MSPRLPINDGVYGAFPNPKLVAEIALGWAWRGAIQPADFTYLCDGESGVAALTAPRYVFRVSAPVMFIALAYAPLCHGILHVVRLRSEKKVRRPAAELGVAVMKAIEARRDVSEGNGVCVAMRKKRPAVNGKETISMGKHSSLPKPAAIVILDDIDLGPEPGNNPRIVSFAHDASLALCVRARAGHQPRLGSA